MKNYKICFIICLIIIYIINVCDKYNIKVCVCTIGKKENRYIREFVEYYKKYGIDQIFLYDNNDQNGERFEEVFDLVFFFWKKRSSNRWKYSLQNGERFEEVISDFINNGFVKLFNWRGKTSPQLKIIKHCYENNHNKFDWLIFYDIDEFIHLKNYKNIKGFLNEKKFINCQNIYLNWALHTDNNLLYYENKSLYERFPILESKGKNNKKYFMPVKSILRGHIPNIEIDCQHKINTSLKSCNGFGLKPKFIKDTMEADFDYYYIDHFYFKSLEEFIEKLNKGSVKHGNELDIKLNKNY